VIDMLFGACDYAVLHRNCLKIRIPEPLKAKDNTAHHVRTLKHPH
jgi:hypothetical protein